MGGGNIRKIMVLTFDDTEEKAVEKSYSIAPKCKQESLIDTKDLQVTVIEMKIQS